MLFCSNFILINSPCSLLNSSLFMYALASPLKSNSFRNSLLTLTAFIAIDELTHSVFSVSCNTSLNSNSRSSANGFWFVLICSRSLFFSRMSDLSLYLLFSNSIKFSFDSVVIIYTSRSLSSFSLFKVYSSTFLLLKQCLHLISCSFSRSKDSEK